MRRFARILGRVLAACAGLLLVAAVAAVLIVRSDWFHDRVRERIVAEVERATGGTAEIGAFQFEWRTLRAEVRELVLRGTEPADHAPLFRAGRVVVGLKVISALDRDINIALLEIHGPELNVEKNDDGSNNLPAPPAAEAARAGQDVMAPIIDLAIGEFHLRDGLWRYGSHEVPFDLSGQDLRADAVYEADAPGYRFRLTGQHFTVGQPEKNSLAVDTELEVLVTAGRIDVERAVVDTGRSRMEAAGVVDDLSEFRCRFDLTAALAMSEVTEHLDLSLEPVGKVEFRGVLERSGGGGFLLTGDASASALAVRNKHVSIEKIRGTARVRATQERIEIADLRVAALDGSFTGAATIDELKRFVVKGDLAGLSLRKLMPSVGVNALAWNGNLSGPVDLAGDFAGAVSGQGRILVEPGGSGLPLEGFVDGAFDTAADTVSFGDSRLLTGSSRIDFTGILQEGISFSVYTESIPELLPALALFGRSPPDSFPIRLKNGVAQFGGLVTGVLKSPLISGHIAAGPFVFKDQVIDAGAADFDCSESRLRLRSVSIRQGESRARGDGEISLSRWAATDDSTLTGDFRIERADLQELLARAGEELPLEGVVTGTAKLAGTVGDPSLRGEFTAGSVKAWGEVVDSVKANVHYANRELRIEDGELRTGDSLLRLDGAYTYEAESWADGAVRFQATAEGFRLGQFEGVRQLRSGLDGAIDGELSGSLEIRDSTPRLTALSGELTIAGVALEDRDLGSARLTARTRRNTLSVRATAGLTAGAKRSELRALAEWNLVRESVGLGQVTFSDLSIDALQDLGLFGGPNTNLYVEGSIDGEIGFVGPVLRPADWRGMARITRFELTPEPQGGRKSDRDLTLHNSGSLLFAIEPAKIEVQSARLVSTDTDLEISGTLSYLRRNPWNLRLKGSANLAVLTAFRDDLLAEGKSTVDANIRGSLLEPQINGRMEFENGSFYLRNLPNGIEQVNGALIFNQTRATIEKFTSRTGGGSLELGGFIGFGGEDWVYRLQARAADVRVRYPEGASTLLNANLDLTGSSTRSLLSGEVSVTRAAFNPDSDLGSVLSDSANLSPPAGISNPFLRAMQFDIHVTTAPNAEFLTSLTRDIEVEADLHLRGSPSRPVLLGRVGVNRGEIQFFGNKYDIVQGEVTFFNPLKIEPVLAMDLETRIRSYTVMMNFSGPLDKLNFNYRSDPPLQSQEIIALLTVGRTPSYGSTSTPTTATDAGYFQAGGASFLGHALTSPVSGRLQRFFGVSRIKIDPRLTGVDNTPETNVTIEQQVSREITLTYVTNLARTQQQIVRIEWHFHPDWSVFAIRDSNGVFGVDFMYRRRFK